MALETSLQNLLGMYFDAQFIAYIRSHSAYTIMIILICNCKYFTLTRKYIVYVDCFMSNSFSTIVVCVSSLRTKFLNHRKHFFSLKYEKLFNYPKEEDKEGLNFGMYSKLYFMIV